MTYGAFTSRDFADYNPRPRSPIPQAFLCAIALVLSASAALWMLYARPAVIAPAVTASAVPASDVPASDVPGTTPVARPAAPRTRLPRPAPRQDFALLDPTFSAGAAPATFAPRLAPASDFGPPLAAAPEADAEPAPPPAAAPAEAPIAPMVDVEEPNAAPAPTSSETIPLPTPRPAFPVIVPHAPFVPRRPERTASVAAPTQPRGFFDTLFGGTRPPGAALAYAAPETTGLGGLRAGVDRWTAVYDIAAHTVTLPSGARLEAHSGLGARLDDPRGVTEHMRGATPPTVYDLEPRAQLFHGVRALRLNPVDPNTTYGRAGLLAHTYMLGPRGDSNGCVVFKDYRAFLQAYESGEIRRLVVVTGAS